MRAARLPRLHGEWDKTTGKMAVNKCLTLHTCKEIASHLPYIEDYYRVELQVFLRDHNTTNLSTPSRTNKADGSTIF